MKPDYPLPPTVTFRISPKLLREIDQRAQAEGVSRADVIRDALVVYVDPDTPPLARDEERSV